MAGDWIKMRSNLAQDPAVISTANALNCSEFKVVGLLHWLWSWADGHTVDGRADGVDCKWIDKQTHTEGFCTALAKTGWLIVDEEGLTIPGFDKHNGASAKSRAQTARRVAKHKSKKAVEEEPKENYNEWPVVKHQAELRAKRAKAKGGKLGEILALLKPGKKYAHLVQDDAKRETLKEWLAYLKERISKKYTSMGAAKHLKDIDEFSADDLRLAVDNSIKNNWQGLFPPKKSNQARATKPKYEEFD